MARRLRSAFSLFLLCLALFSPYLAPEAFGCEASSDTNGGRNYSAAGTELGPYCGADISGGYEMPHAFGADLCLTMRRCRGLAISHLAGGKQVYTHQRSAKTNSGAVVSLTEDTTDEADDGKSTLGASWLAV